MTMDMADRSDAVTRHRENVDTRRSAQLVYVETGSPANLPSEGNSHPTPQLQTPVRDQVILSSPISGGRSDAPVRAFHRRAPWSRSAAFPATVSRWDQYPWLFDL